MQQDARCSCFHKFVICGTSRLIPPMQGLVLEKRSPQIDGVLGALLAKLEKDKPAISAGPDDQQYCENFAVKVFNRADKVDRAGRADKGTATTYYAASVFIEVCPPQLCGAAHTASMLLSKPASWGNAIEILMRSMEMSAEPLPWAARCLVAYRRASGATKVWSEWC